MPIKLVQGSVVYQDTQCIVNAANHTLLGGGGVDGAIHREAGSKLLEECRTLNGCKTGQAKMTKGYNLKAEYVIHTVGPVYSNKKQDEIDLYNCYFNSLILAKENNINSISFCCISTGVYGYPLEEASIIALRAINDFEKLYNLMEIRICCFTEREYNVYRNLLTLK